MKAMMNLNKSMRSTLAAAFAFAVIGGASSAQAAICLDEFGLGLNPVMTTICVTGLPTMITGALTGELREEVIAVQRDAEAHLEGGPMTEALAKTIQKLKESDARFADYSSEQIAGAIVLSK